MRHLLTSILVLAALPTTLTACGDDGSEAQRVGVGAACAANADCAETAPMCLPFKGGYCGVNNCETDAECPAGSACITHDDDVNDCFLLCDDKSVCNTHRTTENESNCGGSVTFVEADAHAGAKACVPPSADK